MANRRYNTNHQPTAELPERASSSPCDVMLEGTSLRTTPLPAPSDVGCSSQHDGAPDHGTGLFSRQAMAAGYPHGVVDLQPRGVLMCPGLPPLPQVAVLAGRGLFLSDPWACRGLSNCKRDQLITARNPSSCKADRQQDCLWSTSSDVAQARGCARGFCGLEFQGQRRFRPWDTV